jgi:hypothetical protein
MVLWDRFLGFNMDKDKEIIKDKLPVQSDYHTRSKGLVHRQQPTTSQDQNIKKSWIMSPTARTTSNVPNTNKASTNNSESMEYIIVEDLKKIKSNILNLDMCKISQQRKLLLNALKDLDVHLATTTKCVNKTKNNNSQTQQ